MAQDVQALTNTETQAPPGGMTQEEIDAFNGGEVETPAVEATPDEPTPAAEAADPVVDEDELTARERGWVEKERWHGKGDWRDFKEFNRIWETRTAPKQFKAELQAERAKNAELASRLEALEKRDQERETTREQIRLETMRGELARAQEEGDWQKVAKITDELLDVKVKGLAPKTPAVRVPDAQEAAAKSALDAFAVANPIFSQDQRLGRALTEQVAVIQAIANQAHQPMPPAELLDEALDRVKRMYPERFRPPPKRPAMAEMNGREANVDTPKRGWSDLNQDAREALDRFITDSPEHMKLGRDKARARLLANADDSYFKRR